MSKCGLVNAILVLTIATAPTTFVSAETASNLRPVYQNTTLAQLKKPSGGSADDFCGVPTCPLVVPAGKTVTLTGDVVCTKAERSSGTGGDHGIAVKVEAGGTLKCDGYTVTQLNDKGANAVDCGDDDLAVTQCGLGWGKTGISLLPGASAKDCKVSGWKRGIVIQTNDSSQTNGISSGPGGGGGAEEVNIEGVDVSYNNVGLSVDVEVEDDVNFSIKKR